MKRRSFLDDRGGGGRDRSDGRAAPDGDTAGDQTPAAAEPVAGMPRGNWERTGQYLSIIGYAGFALRDKERTQAECTASLSKALQNGINYFDVAPAYDDGLCEIRMGQGFSEIGEYRRESIFLACKTKQRTRAGAGRTRAFPAPTEDRLLRPVSTPLPDQAGRRCRAEPSPPTARWRRSWRRKNKARSSTSGSRRTRPRRVGGHARLPLRFGDVPDQLPRALHVRFRQEGL